jgi:hypothetical protein
MEATPSARRHGVSIASIEHAIQHAVVFELLEDDEIEKFLVIGTDEAGNLLEIVGTTSDDGVVVVFHAMAMRKSYRALLPNNRKD